VVTDNLREACPNSGDRGIEQILGRIETDRANGVTRNQALQNAQAVCATSDEAACLGCNNAAVNYVYDQPADGGGGEGEGGGDGGAGTNGGEGEGDGGAGTNGEEGEGGFGTGGGGFGTGGGGFGTGGGDGFGTGG